MTSSLKILFAIGLASGAALATDDRPPGQTLQPVAPLQAAFEGMTGAELFAKLLERNQVREALLRQYTVLRTYEVTNDQGKMYARQVVRLDYRAPDRKSFHTESEEGSGLVRNMVLKRLIESESETSSGRAHKDSSIRPANYAFNLLGEQDVGPYHCLVVEANPKRKDKYLFQGRVWIDVHDYAIVRIAGQPAKSLSFWITRADFVRQYEKIGDFWLPARDETFVRVRLSGKKILTIDHRDYAVNEGAAGRGNDLAPENQAKETK
jgi:hypothetical protein